MKGRKEKKMERPQCTDYYFGGENCKRPAIYYVEPEARKGNRIPVCGLCARKFLAEALHPLRMKDWNKWYGGK